MRIIATGPRRRAAGLRSTSSRGHPRRGQPDAPFCAQGPRPAARRRPPDGGLRCRRAAAAPAPARLGSTFLPNHHLSPLGVLGVHGEGRRREWCPVLRGEWSLHLSFTSWPPRRRENRDRGRRRTGVMVIAPPADANAQDASISAGFVHHAAVLSGPEAHSANLSLVVGHRTNCRCARKSMKPRVGSRRDEAQYGCAVADVEPSSFWTTRPSAGGSMVRTNVPLVHAGDDRVVLRPDARRREKRGAHTLCIVRSNAGMVPRSAAFRDEGELPPQSNGGRSPAHRDLRSRCVTRSP